MDEIEAKLELYAITKSQIKNLTEEASDLAKEILDHMANNGLKKKETVFGNFSITTRKAWVYPEEITDMAEDLKALQAKAQSTGEAQYEESQSLLFKPVTL